MIRGYRTGNYKSPVIPELMFQPLLVDGVEVPNWVPAVYPVHPSYDNFSTEAMLKAGVDPSSIHIHVQSADRIDGYNAVEAFAAAAEQVLQEPAE